MKNNAIHLSSNYFDKIKPWCGAVSNLCTRETPHSEEQWGKICFECRRQYNILIDENERERQEWIKEQDARPTSVKVRESLEQFANFGNHTYDAVPILGLHIITFGLSSFLLEASQKVVRFALNKTK